MSQKNQGRPIEILMVEDNPDDVFLTREALLEHHPELRLHVAEDGEKALAFLRRRDVDAAHPHPDLILLDLNMPRMNGLEVLAEMKADPDLLSIPVVVLTTSQSQDDIRRAYELHGNCYITKPVNLDEFLAVMSTIENFWLNVAHLPLYETNESNR